MQAVIQVDSSQYLVEPGQEILVSGKSEPKVLLVIDGEKILVGQPYVTGFKVATKDLGTTKGKKIRVSTYKAKSRYRKTKGFRSQYTKVKIDKISRGD